MSNDRMTTALSVTAKGAAVAIATTTPATIVASLGFLPDFLKALPKSNDAKVAEAVEEGLKEDAMSEAVYNKVMEKLESSWKDRPEAERPTVDDVRHSVVQLMKARAKAHDHKKRKMLWAAFWSSLKPEFYDSEIRDLLWEKLNNLNYADLVFLEKVLAEGDRSLTILKHSADIEHAQRLEKQDLVYFVDADTKGADKRTVYRKGYAEKMPKFALTEGDSSP